MDEDFEQQSWSCPKQLSRPHIKGQGIESIPHIKKCTLINYLSESLKEADIKWSLFCAACNSYRFDSVLKPFPPLFVVNPENKEIEHLRRVIESCPSLIQVIQNLKDDKISETLQDLLYWVLIQLNEPVFKYEAKEEHSNILSQVPSMAGAALPDYIFKVTYGTRAQQKFALTALNRTTKMAFHGSRLENFFSIVNHGLQVSYNKRGMFGPGTYLSSEMSLSLTYSPVGYAWNYSTFGSHISIVALCEIIDHPEVRSEFDSRKGSNANLLDICGNQSTPGKYFIVENNDFVRVRYLLVYGSYDSEAASLRTSPTILGWIKRHKMFTFALAYVILLLAIGSSNSSLISKYFRRLLR
ncbi:hypothetical protein RUM43_004360 [Polyplax serrata]|uniref:Poly [ADP-ribose] polymerase n=1 Tax=Polyplax serrata TaxID=468196 RepID=A0AAN8SAS6_POLSC